MVMAFLMMGTLAMFVETNPSFYMAFIFIFTPDLSDSSRTSFAENATLAYHLLSSGSWQRDL